MKETKFTNRLPYGNYDFAKVAKAVKRQLAGGRVLVLIYFSTLDLWTWRPIDFFQHRDASVGSWDLSGSQTSDKVATILDEFFDTQPGIGPMP